MRWRVRRRTFLEIWNALFSALEGVTAVESGLKRRKVNG
jgi:hypothetical protein